MKGSSFPFAKYREWGANATTVTELNTDAIQQLSEWQDTLYKRPILDDITGSYQFYPSENGAKAYVNGTARNRPVNSDELEDGDTLEGKTARQLMHIASNSELATALFWTIALVRHDHLAQTINTVVDNPDQDVELTYGTKLAADAIADYGYCLENPVDLEFSGKNRSKGLKKEIRRVAPGVGKSLLSLGDFATEEPDILRSYDGIVAMQTVLVEQERRYNHWSPRHEAIHRAFPSVPLSKEVLYQSIETHEIFWLYDQIKVA